MDQSRKTRICMLRRYKMTQCKSCGADLPPSKKEVRDNKQIKIEELIPFFKKGWVFYNNNIGWCWSKIKPTWSRMWGSWDVEADWENEIALYKMFNIVPAKDSIKSLIRVGGK